MESQMLKDLLRSSEFIQKIFWLVITFSILIWMGVAFYLADQPGSAVRDVDRTIQILFSVLAVGSGVASVLLRRFLLSDKRLQVQLALKVDPLSLATNAKTGQVDKSLLAKVESLDLSELKLFAIADWYFMSFAPSLGLNEAIAICGFILSYLANSGEPIIPFALAALILNGLMFPHLEKILERARRINRNP